MGTDWEGMLGASGAGIEDAYDSAVAAAMEQDKKDNPPKKPAR